MMIIQALSEVQDPNGLEISAICKFIEVSGKPVIFIGYFTQRTACKGYPRPQSQ